MNDRSTSIARLQFLGTQRITIGADVITPESERLFAMIVRLCVPLGRLTSRQTMLDLLWPGAEDAPARHNLRQTVYKARELGLVVESDEDGLRLDPRHWSCDWEDAVGDVPGEWLCGYEPEFSDELRSWIGSQQIGVHASLRPRLIRTLQAARSSGDLLLADRHAVQLLRVDELNEEATLTRAEVMALQGAKIDALKLLDAYLHEIGRLGSGKDAALPAQLLRRRIAEKLPALTYNNGSQHYGPLIGRAEEAKRLIGGLFDARAGRGTATLVHGAEGVGKSRLLLEVRRAAILQGMQMLEVSCESVPRSTPLSMLRELVRRLLEVRGACGISETAMSSVRAWLISNETAPDDCPLMEIEDLLASVSEETPLLVLMEHAERMDAESLGRLDRLYRRGVSRYHQLILTSSTYATPSDAAVALSEIERLALRPMSLVEVRDVVTAFAAAALPRATSDQVACAAVFAEGNPMYGVEMLGLILDDGSPDVIPWRVKVAVERVVVRASEMQLRVLALCRLLGPCAQHRVLEAALHYELEAFVCTIDALERDAALKFEDGIFIASPLLSEAVRAKLGAELLRRDALSGANALNTIGNSLHDPLTLYASLRCLVAARADEKAILVLDSNVGELVRNDSAANVIYFLTQIREASESCELASLIDGTIDQIRAGTEGKRAKKGAPSARTRASSLPCVSPTSLEVAHTLSSPQCLTTTLVASRDPFSSPGNRLAEAVMALMVASNLGDFHALRAAYRSVQAVRYAKDVDQFDVHRADVIYFTSLGACSDALASAERLALQSRLVKDVHLACKGFRNAAQVFLSFGRASIAQSLLHESRALASRLGYASQQAWADIRLADLCILEMDAPGALSYLDAAEWTIRQEALSIPLLDYDLGMHRCWASLIHGDFVTAQKCARTICRRVPGTQTGIALWTRLAVKIATHRGKHSLEIDREFNTLKDSIGSRPFYGDEQYALAALLLFSKDRLNFGEVSEFARAQFGRIEAMGQTVWPFVISNLADLRRE